MKIDPERAVNSTSLKYTIYYLRTWIKEYQDKINPPREYPLDLGLIENSPKLIDKSIME
jgi:hypothetical protein